MTTIYFVRHAQPDYRGGSDRERGLTAEAMEDRKIVLDFLRDKPEIGRASCRERV